MLGALKGLRWYWRGTVLVALALLAFSLSSWAATQTQLDAARAAALAWLIERQQGDGSWRGRPGNDIQVSANSLLAMERAGVNGYVHSRGLSWLTNAEPRSIDALAQQAIVLQGAGLQTQPLFEALIARRNRLSAWGAYSQFSTSFPDTPLAMRALRSDAATYQAERSKLLIGLCEILRSQKTASDAGSWSYLAADDPALVSTGKSAVIPTAQNVVELHAFIALGYSARTCNGYNFNLATAVDAGVDWLIGLVDGDGGIGVDGSTVLETSAAFLVIDTVRSGAPSLAVLQDYLVNTQAADGAWEQDALVTALAARTFAATQLADTDGDGLPDVVEARLGTDPGLADARALVKGNGASELGITAPHVFSARLGQPFSADLMITGGVAPYSWRVTGFLPDGIASVGSTTATNTLAGTPTVTGTFNFGYGVTDANGTVLTGNGQLRVNIPPVLAAPADPVSSEGAAVSLTVAASDEDGDSLSYSASGLPPGLSINAATGEIVGNLDYVSTGVYAGATVTVSDGSDAVSQQFTWTVNDVDREPVIDTAPASLTSDEGAAIALGATASDPDGLAVGFSYTNLPPGVTYSSATGDITGTPTYEAAGTYSITLTVSDGRLQATHGFVWTVNDINRAPLLDDLGVIFVNEGSQTDLTLAFSDPDNHNLSVTVNSVATFVTATPNPDGTITLTIAPGSDDAQSASYPVIVSVTDTHAAPLTTSKTLQIGVIEDSGATHVVQLSSGYGDFKLELYGAVAPQAVSAFLTLVSTGDLEGSLADHIGFPTQRPILQGGGLRLEGSQWDRVNEGGVLASEPGIAHEYGTVALTSAPGLWPNFSRSQWFINPADNSSALSSATQTVFGRVVDGWPVISAIANTPVYNASAIDFAGIGRAEESTLTQLPLVNASIPILLGGVVELSAYARPCTLIGIAGEPFQSEFPLPVGLTAPYTYAISSGALPPGVTLDPVTGIIAGATNAGGRYPFSYTMTDALSAQASAHCTFIVNSPPVVQMIADQSNEEGESVSVPVLATDADPGDILTYGLASGHLLPQGVNIDPVTGVMSGVIAAASAGSYTPVVTVSDGIFTLSETFGWLVDAADGLVVTDIADVTMDEGDSVDVAVTASGVAVSLCIVPGSPLPPFVTLADNGDGTGSIHIAPTHADAGSYTVAVTVGASQSLCTRPPEAQLFAPVRKTFTVDVADVNQPPAVMLPGAQSHRAGATVNLPIPASDPEGGTLRFAAVDLPAGLTIDAASGTISGAIALDARGDYSVALSILDVLDNRVHGYTLQWTVTANNIAPTAIDDAVSTDEDVALTFDVRVNDTDANGDVLAIDSHTAVANGTLVLNADGTFSYTPNAQFSGSESFDYVITDGASSDTGTVTITVEAVNDPPSVTNPVLVSSAENDTVNLTLVASDEEGQALTYSASGLPGGLSMNADTGAVTGVLGYTTAGSYTVAANVADAGGASTEVVFTWVVRDINQAPVAAADSVSTPEDTPASIAVLANDVEPDGQALAVTAVTQPSDGTAIINADNTVTYTPNQNFFGADTFHYTVSDGLLGINVAAVSVTVTAQNDAPVAVADSVTVDEGTWAVVDLAANDIDVENALDLASIAITVGANHGTLVNDGDGTVGYRHDGSETTGDSFTYTIADTSGASSNPVSVTITVTPVNDAPIAAADAGAVAEGATQNIDIAGNDTDAENALDPNSVTIVSAPMNGSVRIFADGTVDYTHDSSETLADRFQYTIADTSGTPSNVASVAITVSAVNDAPVASDDSTVVAEGASLSIDVVGNDADADDGLDLTSVVIVAGATNGTLVVNSNGTVVYEHDGSETLSDSFSYTVADVGGAVSNVAIVAITVAPTNDNPVAVGETVAVDEGGAVTINVVVNDTDSDDALNPSSVSVVSGTTNGVLINHADGTLTYTHDGSETTADSFSYTIADTTGAVSNAATVTISVTPQNDAPVATADSQTVAEAGAVVIDVAGNDSDPDDGIVASSVVVVAGATNGSLTNNLDGTVTYTHDGSETTSDSFTYTITDGSGAVSNVATVSIAVTPHNDAPVAVADSGLVNEGAAQTINLIANDTDADDGIDPSSLVVVVAPAHGSLSLLGDGTVSYTHDGSETTTDSFSYRVSDFAGAPSNTVTANISITPINDIPIAAADTGSVVEGYSVILNLAANDTDADDGIDPASIVVTAPVSNGSLIVNGDGTVSYTHNGGETTSDGFSYTIADASGALSNVAAVTITVTAQNDAPVAAGDSAVLNEGASTTINLVANDTDADDGVDPSSIAIISGVANGNVVINANGTVDYAHDGGETTSDSFTYTISDVAGAVSNAAPVSITVTPVNDAPVAVADAARTVGGIEVVVPVLANDVDADGDPLQVSAVTPASHGVIRHDGMRIHYTPEVDFAGVERVDYTVVDGQGGSHGAALTITVEAPGVTAPPRLVEPPNETEVATLAPPLVVAHEIHDPRLEVGYEFELYEDPQMQVLVRRATVTAGTQTLTAWPVFPPLDADNQWYDWRARAFNAGGHSVWVNGDFFVNTENDAPGPLPLSAPGIGVEVDSLKPTLEVVNSVDVDQGAAPLTYVFAVYENDPGISPEVWPLVESSALAAGDEGVTAWRVEVALRENREYHWQVTVSDEHGARTRSDVGRFFVNTANEAPRSPAVAAPWVDEEVPTQAVRLQVHNAVDADRDTLHYTFELDRGETFDSAFQQRSERLPAGVGTTSWDVEGLADNTWYVWRVKADDGVAESGWTNGRFFVNTQNDAPSIPTVRNPGNGAWVETRRPALAVNASTDEDEDALDYEFELYTDLHRPAVLTSAVEVEPRYESTSWTPRMLLDDHRWYAWRARAVDEHGAASAPMEWQWFFVNDNGVDDAPELEWVLPYTDIEIPTEDGQVWLRWQVRLRWEDSDPDSNARVSLYYERADVDGPVGTLIAADIEEDLDDWGDEYPWEVSGLYPGHYRVYAHIRDARNEVRVYAPGVVTVMALVLPGDLNGDGMTDLADLYYIASSYEACTGAPNFVARADYDADGCVTWRDFEVWYYDYFLTR